MRSAGGIRRYAGSIEASPSRPNAKTATVPSGGTTAHYSSSASACDQEEGAFSEGDANRVVRRHRNAGSVRSSSAPQVEAGRFDCSGRGEHYIEARVGGKRRSPLMFCATDRDSSSPRRQSRRCCSPEDGMYLWKTSWGSSDGTGRFGRQ